MNRLGDVRRADVAVAMTVARGLFHTLQQHVPPFRAQSRDSGRCRVAVTAQLMTAPLVSRAKAQGERRELGMSAVGSDPEILRPSISSLLHPPTADIAPTCRVAAAAGCMVG
jgi:hypothetical protein